MGQSVRLRRRRRQEADPGPWGIRGNKGAMAMVAGASDPDRGRGALAVRSAAAVGRSVVAAVPSAVVTAGSRPADRAGPGLYSRPFGRRIRRAAPAAAGSAGSPTVVAWFCCCWRSSCFGSAAASIGCSQTSRAWFCDSAPTPIGRRLVCIGTSPGRSRVWSFRRLPVSTAPKSATAPRPAAMSKPARIPRVATCLPRA